MADDGHDPVVAQLRAWADDLVARAEPSVQETTDVRRRRASLSLAAALVAAAAITTVVVVQLRSGTHEVGPVSPTSATATVPVPTTIPVTAPTAVDATDPTSPPTSVIVSPTTSVAPASPGGSVSYLSPPPALNLQMLATVPYMPCCGGALRVAIGDQGVVVNQSWLGHMTTIGFDGETTDVPIDGEISAITYGPGDVVYGLRSGAEISDFAIVAVAMSGDLQGTTVASVSLPWVAYTELPDGAFGHGTSGIIDRVRTVNSTVIGYVDSSGQPLSWPEAPPTYTAKDVATASPPWQSVVVSTPGLTWRLDIEWAPDAAGSSSGPAPPAPSSDGLAVKWSFIGPDSSPDSDSGFGEPTMPVIAAMSSDGSVRWWSVPEDWTVVASDVWGTVLARINGDSIDIALADW